MPKDSKSKCESASHQNLKEKTKNHVDDLQRLFLNLESARKDYRADDVSVLEEQVNQMLREWKTELAEPSPASSLIGGSLGFSEEIARLLHVYDLEDDATSPLGELSQPKPEHEPLAHYENFPSQSSIFSEDIFDVKGLDDHSFPGFSEFQGDIASDFPVLMAQAENHQFVQYQEFVADHGVEALRDVQPGISPPPSAFLGPICALWDCSRPAQGLSACQDYCSSCHAVLALNEGLPGVFPVARPGGLVVKDGTLFAALRLKLQGKEVGIPRCDGAAYSKCPWNASELFDVALLEGESIREWLFFDKPKRANESGSKKQRSLPDYDGRGWHESRKQVMKEFGGHKRSYFMDPQPSSFHEWHLFEYEISDSGSFTLYRLELKLGDGKKSPKGNVDRKKNSKVSVSSTKDPLADLQKKMGRLTAETSTSDGNNSPSGGTGSG